MKKNYQTIRAIAALLIFMTFSGGAQLNYCQSAPFVNADEEIYNVMVNGAQTNVLYSFSNGCSTPAPGPGSSIGLYSNFRTLPALTNLIQGIATTFSVEENECDGAPYYSHGIGVWIDFNQNGSFADPGENIYLDASTLGGPRNVAGTFTVPLAALTGSTVMRVICAEGYAGGSLNSCLNSYGYGETEDYRIDILPAVPCSGQPAANTIVGPTAPICPNTSVGLSLANTYTNLGITYLWQSSTTSSVGPFAATNGTESAYGTPNLNNTTWYTAVITCSAGNQTYTTAPIMITVEGLVTNTIPYYEGFEGISVNNKLPNCSWAANNLGSTALTYVNAAANNRVPRTGNKFASFYYSPAGSRNFYSNGLQMNAGVTYSATIWYTTEFNGYNNWTNLSLLVGPNQTPVAQQTVASIGPAISPFYSALTNTFTVPTSGIYYVNIRATSSAASSALYLTWDDLSVIVPCQLGTNTPSVSVSVSNATICSGTPVSFTASGADSYMWNTGANTTMMSDIPNNSMMYTVVGTNSASGCGVTVSQQVIVNPSPLVSVVAIPPQVCLGKTVALVATGANNYTWSANGNGPFLNISPTANGTYSVAGMNQYLCIGRASISVTVNPLPNVQGISSPSLICVGESATLLGNGATSYQWMANNAFIQSNPANVSPLTSTGYTLLGTDNKGCTNTAIVALGVSECTGIGKLSAGSGMKLFPNPNEGMFSVTLGNGLENKIELMDMNGKVVYSISSAAPVVDINISDLANGIYYVKVQNSASVEVAKIVKQ